MNPGSMNLASAIATFATAQASSALDPAADQAAAIDDVWNLMLWICGTMYLLVMIGVAFAVWRHRALRRNQPVATPSESGLTGAIAVWIALIVLGLAALTITSFLVDRKLIPGNDAALNIRITGRQWWWKIEYLSDDPSQQFETANELHLPVGRKTHIELRSDDVIHSFWVPNLAGKRDLIPGRINEIELTPRRTGTFRGPCAEFCGLQHAKMSLLVSVDDDAAFDTWRAQQLSDAPQPSDGLARQGESLFTHTACVMCHAVRGTSASSNAGPDLTHLASRRTLASGALPLERGTLAAWLADPQRIKPGTNMPQVRLDPDQLNALVAYLLSLK
ncbi:MAG TPA: cytochrome c oxidase subunit II [Rudaea sp.]